MWTFESTMAMKRLTIAILALVCALTVNAELTLENVITGARIDPYDKQDTSAVVAFPTHEGVMYIQRDFDRNYKTVILLNALESVSAAISSFTTATPRSESMSEIFWCTIGSVW